MPIATHEQYQEMLSRARAGKYAFPAINVTGLETLSAAMAAFAEAGSDGIIQISTGGGKHASGPVGDMALGAEVLAEAAHRLAERYPVLFALHTDHCHPSNLEPFLDPLLLASERRVKAGQGPLFQSHMFDGSELSLAENLAISERYLARCAPLGIILEIETGVVGGEEDGHDTSGVAKEKLYTTPEDMVEAYERLEGKGQWMLAATFGNVHGVYKPGNVKLTPTILRDGQSAVQSKHRTVDNPLLLVFHGGSGSSLAEIHETLEYGVVKMNVDTDCQYAFTRPIADHMLRHYDGVLKVDGEVGNKKVYDPRSYLKLATTSMKARVIQAVKDLRGEGRSLLR
ncbi:MAG: class II fructose-bisphosphate aldolase [Polyangiaceae bacterium]|nr:class II fructose-bisphosphate aldolase [Polyangiaceae bacterium]MCW5791848.1 class II fructose-bisphosphate aldolase [Polyangiaceae bacterium]